MRFGKRKGLSLLLAAVLLLTCFPLSASAAQAEPDLSPLATPSTDTLSLPSYYEYQKSITVQPATQPLPLSVAQATLSAEDAETVTYLEKPAVRLSPSGYLEWTVSVPTDATYLVSLTYASEQGIGQMLELMMTVDGEYPFREATGLTLKRLWQDATEIRQDAHGNDLVPEQAELSAWQTADLSDTSGYTSDSYRVLLTAGTHTLRLTAGDYPLYLAAATLDVPPKRADYAAALSQWQAAGYQPQDNVRLTYAAETPLLKSDRTIFATYDLGNAATVPSEPGVIKRNVIGGTNWKKAGEWITYEVEVPADGLYLLTFKYRQNISLDMTVYRNVYINGEIPYTELEAVEFPYSYRWRNLTLTGKDGQQLYVKLDQGVNTIRLETTTGEWAPILQDVDSLAMEMNDLYRRIIMVTGTTPDTYHDYHLESEIRGLGEKLADLAKRTHAAADAYEAINGGVSQQSAVLRTVADQMDVFAKKTEKIPKGLATFREKITALTDWLLNNKEQPLEMDYFMVHSAGAEIPSARGHWWTNLIFAIRRFFATFSADYASLEDYDENSEQRMITVWISDGRDQATILKDMIADTFTSETGIAVNVNLVQGGLIEAVLAGKAPDVAINVARGQPVNLASRGALMDLTQFTELSQVSERFTDDALIPYSYDGGVYALPMTQTYQTMFYRTDIFRELGLEVPQTWDEFMDVAAVLQRNNMKVGLPYTAITAAGAVEVGVGAKDLYPSLLMQGGGRFYNADLTATALDNQQALDAFETWTGFYTDYGFDLSYDFATLFRSGEMPLCITAYPMYGTLAAVATEIRGCWEMTTLPGTPQEDGSIDRSVGASGSAAVILRDAKDPEACWQFLEWFTRTDTQADYGNRLENQLGEAARYASANLAAVELLNWNSQERAVLREQRLWVNEIPEIPGSYYTSRCLDNAFRSVVYDGDNPREVFEKQVKIINSELERKRLELE